MRRGSVGNRVRCERLITHDTVRSPMRSSFREHISRSYAWEALTRTHSEVQRLTNTLQPHLREMGAKWGVAQREAFVVDTLELQGWSCLFAGGESRYCWNEPDAMRERIAFLKLQWSHIVPASFQPASDPGDLVLLCARCNNNLQKSRPVEYLIDELHHKLAVLQRLKREGNRWRA